MELFFFRSCFFSLLWLLIDSRREKKKFYVYDFIKAIYTLVWSGWFACVLVLGILCVKSKNAVKLVQEIEKVFHESSTQWHSFTMYQN